MPSATIQIINLLAGSMLFLCFAMLMQRRTLNLIKLLALQGLVLSIEIALIASITVHPKLYISVALTLLLNVWLIPFILHRLLTRLGARSSFEPLLNVPSVLLIGIFLVIIAFNLSIPVTEITSTHDPSTIAIALASVLVSLLILIVKKRAISLVIGFLSLENSLFFVATTMTHGMPIVVELGIALDLLLGLFIFGLFFFQMQERFESFEVHHLEQLRDE